MSPVLVKSAKQHATVIRNIVVIQVLDLKIILMVFNVIYILY